LSGKGKRKADGNSRAGTRALVLLSTPTTAQIVEALVQGRKALADLRREVGSPPQTTMRSHLRALVETGVIERLRLHAFPASTDYELTASGRDFWAVAELLRGWLAKAPDGPLELGSTAARSAVKALVDGWDTAIIRALAARPLTLTQLDDIIASINYPSLERRLVAMRLAGQVERVSSGGRGTPYRATTWLRHAIAPLAAAAQWERLNHAPVTSPISRLDVEAAFLLAIPMVELPADLDGACRLAVEVPSAKGEGLAGVWVAVEGGRVASCVTKLSGEADAWASGSAPAWVRAVLGRNVRELQVGGDSTLPNGLVDGLNRALIGSPGAPADPRKVRSLP
jgi:DNA-binding HxlR family transcriptional regulator